MLLCHSVFRFVLGDYTLKTLIESPHYSKVLRLINDNTDGPAGAFSLQNVARMGVVYNKYPCEWHGNKSISMVFKALNKLYKPIENFEICVFGDSCVVFDKIINAGKRSTRVWLYDALDKIH